MLGRSNDLFTQGNTAEENLRYNVIRHESKEMLEKNIYKEAAKRVVFDNCMNACGIDAKTVPNFNKNFYYYQDRERNCLSDCINTRMKIHFGSSAAKEGLLFDFDAMKREY